MSESQTDRDISQGIELLCALYALRLDTLARKFRTALIRYARGSLGRLEFLKAMVEAMTSIPEIIASAINQEILNYKGD